jgi:hypothetical protein
MFVILKECVLVHGLSPPATSPAIGAEDTSKSVAIETFLPARHGLAGAAAGKAGLPPVVTESAFFPSLIA